MIHKRGKVDYWLIIISMILLGTGFVLVLSSSQYFAQQEFGDSFYFLKRQVFNALLGLVFLYIAYKMDYHHYKKFTIIALAVSFLLVLMVLMTNLGDDSKGAVRWLQIGPIRFQPSEFMKIGIVMFLAHYFATNQEHIGSWGKGFLVPVSILGLACLLVAKEDLGTGMVIGIVGLIVMACGGMKKSQIAAILGAGVGAVVLLIAIAPYRIKRILSFFDPWSDPIGGGYQAVQSMTAIGSGGLTGTGLGLGGAKWYYVPEGHTDFIYSIGAEELGFLGAVLILICFFAFTWRGLNVARNMPDVYGTLLATGLTCLISVQAFLNIAITLGVAPVTGLTLPFISYGGSSLVIILGSIGMLLSLSRYSNIKK